MYIGKYENHRIGLIPKIEGVTLETLICTYAVVNLRVGSYVVLSNINMGAKPSTFWRTVPESSRQAFTKDIVVLKCKDAAEADALCRSIGRSFADAHSFEDGSLIDSNIEFE